MVLEVLVTEPISITANFSKLNYSLSITSTTEWNGSWRRIYKHGEIAVVQAIRRRLFIQRMDRCSVDPEAASTQLAITTGTQLHASFEPRPINQYGLVLSSVPSQGGTTTGSGVYDSGEVVRVIARPMQGYKFAGWEGAEESDKNESNTTVLVTEDISLSARFEELEYSVGGVTAGVGGSTSGSGTYNYGEVVIIEAVPAVGYKFFGWEGAEAEEYSEAETTVFVDGNLSIEGKFDQEKWSLP